MTIANTPSWGSGKGEERIHLASAFLQVEYDLGSGSASLSTASSRPLMLSATAGAALRQGDALASDPRYTRGYRIVTLTDPPLAGPQLIVLCHDTHRHIDLEYRITLLLRCHRSRKDAGLCQKFFPTLPPDRSADRGRHDAWRAYAPRCRCKKGLLKCLFAV